MITVKKIRTEIEEWRDVPGYEGLYQVSNLGRVRSLNFEGINGKIKLLKPYSVKGGYMVARLSKNSKRKKILVHRLVGFAFPEICGQYFESATINHLDENPKNNRPENLRWCTQKENNLYGNHLKKLSSALKGKNGKRVIQFSKSGNYIQEFKSAHTAQEKLGVSHSHISQVCNGIRKTAGGFIWRYA